MVYKFKKIIGKPSFSDLFKKIVNHCKKVGYNLCIMWQTACLMFYPIMVDSHAANDAELVWD